MHGQRASARGRGKWLRRIAAAFAATSWTAHIALAGHAECDTEGVRRRVSAAMAVIESATDPCGDTWEIRKTLTALRRCDAATYRICIDVESPRNEVDPRIPATGAPTQLTWNPQLRSELQDVCADDPAQAVWRDPTASLLHEIVHVVQDCNGLDPGMHEADALRIENVYRRARGLCQRTLYGSDPLPPSAFRSCAIGACSCERARNRQLVQERSQVARPAVAAGDGHAGRAPTAR